MSNILYINSILCYFNAMNYQRSLVLTLREIFSRPTTVIHAMIGPRQVGKTTIARQLEASLGFPTLYATADSPTPLDAGWIETQWRRESATSPTP